MIKIRQAVSIGLLSLISFEAFSENNFLDNVSGSIGLQGQLFIEDPLNQNQSKHGGVSVYASPEYKYRSEDDDAKFVFNPFYRWDSVDEKRSHGDIRQLDYVRAKGDWEFQVGIGRHFWGVTESQHLVDIINQTDAVEGGAGDDKLGQPLLRASRLTDNGSIDLFVLPYFRERTFPGEKSRLRLPFVVNTNNTVYESKDNEKNIDYALRWSESIEEFDVGLSVFKGTSRDPDLSTGSPFYPLISQYGLELQYTGESIIWKLEAIQRQPNSSASKFNKYSAASGGFEYTLPSIGDSGAEVGLLAEYHTDTRDDAAKVALQNDVFMGARLALNDESSTEMLAGAMIDLDNSSKSLRVEASRRIGDGYKLKLEAQVFTDIDGADAFNSFAKDDFIQIELQNFF